MPGELEARVIGDLSGTVTVCVPGWGTTGQIFSFCDIPSPSIVVDAYNPYTFTDELSALLDAEGISDISLFGFSMGGFAAAAFAAAHPGRVTSLLLAGIRKQYEKSAIESIRAELIQDRHRFMGGFYLSFFRDSRDRMLFRTAVEPGCLAIDDKNLQIGLDYLAETELKKEGITDIPKIIVIHGARDKIAPISEAKSLSDGLNGEFVQIDGELHCPIWHPIVKNILKTT